MHCPAVAFVIKVYVDHIIKPVVSYRVKLSSYKIKLSITTSYLFITHASKFHQEAELHNQYIYYY